MNTFNVLESSNLNSQYRFDEVKFPTVEYSNKFSFNPILVLSTIFFKKDLVTFLNNGKIVRELPLKEYNLYEYNQTGENLKLSISDMYFNIDKSDENIKLIERFKQSVENSKRNSTINYIKIGYIASIIIAIFLISFKLMLYAGFIFSLNKDLLHQIKKDSVKAILSIFFVGDTRFELVTPCL